MRKPKQKQSPRVARGGARVTDLSLKYGEGVMAALEAVKIGQKAGVLTNAKAVAILDAVAERLLSVPAELAEPSALSWLRSP